jgi:hypothetical protein
MVAWDGSINQTGISDEMKYGALKIERMKSILFSVLDSVWMPEHERPELTPPEIQPVRPLAAPQDFEEVRRMLLDRSSWENLRGDNLLQFIE